MDELQVIEKQLENTEYTIEDYLNLKNRMMDEKSKKILFNRVMLDTTKDAYYSLITQKDMIEGMGFDTEYNKIMYEHLLFLLKDNNYKKKIYILGFSDNYIVPRCDLWQSWNPLNVICIFDNIKKEDEYDYDATGQVYIKVCALNRINEYDFTDSILIVGNPNYIPVRDEMIKNNVISKDNVFTFYIPPTGEMKTEYFSEEFMNIKDDSVFVDGGAYNFDTSILFSNWTYGRYKKIYSFEPIKEQYEECLNIQNEYKLHDVELYCLGLSNEKKQLKFNNDGSASREKEDGDTIVDVDSLDNILKGEKADIIKLDVEGAEYEAIEGAKNTIKKYNPTLIVCIYHMPLDILKLSKLILSYNSNYKIYARHNSYTMYETALYFKM